MKLAIAQIMFTQSIEIDETQLQELADSIKEKGLSHPIVVRWAKEFSDPFKPLGEKYHLVSGEKRLLAHKILNLSEIEADIRELTEDEAVELRIHENIRRFNLQWWEQAIQHEQLHALRQKQHGVAIRTGRPPSEGKKEKVGWGIVDTARELSIGTGSLSEDLSLARALRDDPTLKKVTDRKTAVRLARVVAQRHQSQLDAGIPTAFEANEVYLGDSASVLHNFEPNSIDHSITDPPWIKFFEPSLRIDERTLPVFRELYRVLKHGAFLFVVCGLDDYAYYAGTTRPDPDNPTASIHERGELEKIGFSVANTPVIWQKVNSLSRRGVRPWEYDRDFEFVIVAVKGSPALTTSRRLSGIKTFPIVHPSHMIHANEKPIELIMDLLEDCSYRHNIIVDPFGGSGVLAEACIRMERKYIVIERDKAAYDKIVERLRARKIPS